MVKVEETGREARVGANVSKARPKVKAAGQSTVGVIVLTIILKLCGVDVEKVDPLILVTVAGAIPTLAAYLKKDGLSGVWSMIVRGQSGTVRITNEQSLTTEPNDEGSLYDDPKGE